MEFDSAIVGLGLQQCIVPYTAVSQQCHTPLCEVEALILSALLRGVITGKVDAQSQQVHIYNVNHRLCPKDGSAGILAGQALLQRTEKALITRISQAKQHLDSHPIGDSTLAASIATTRLAATTESECSSDNNYESSGAEDAEALSDRSRRTSSETQGRFRRRLN